MHFSIKKSQTANSKTKLLIALMEEMGGKKKEQGRSFQMHEHTFHFQK